MNLQLFYLYTELIPQKKLKEINKGLPNWPYKKICKELLALCRKNKNVKVYINGSSNAYDTLIKMVTPNIVFDCTGGRSDTIIRHKKHHFKNKTNNTPDIYESENICEGTTKIWGKSPFYECSKYLPAKIIRYNRENSYIHLICGSGAIKSSPIVGETIYMGIDLSIYYYILLFNKKLNIEKYNTIRTILGTDFTNFNMNIIH